jgi:predicted RNase H-like HicB family nuclease
MKASITITAVVSRDSETGLYSAYCAEFPEAMSQAESKEKAIELLVGLLPHVLRDRKEESLMLLKKTSPSISTREMSFAAVV